MWDGRFVQRRFLENSGLSEFRGLCYTLCFTMTSALRHFDKHLCSEAKAAYFSWLNLAVITLLQWLSVRVQPLRSSTDQEVFSPCPQPNLRLNTSWLKEVISNFYCKSVRTVQLKSPHFFMLIKIRPLWVSTKVSGFKRADDITMWLTLI